jgi:hypothetical protein
MDGLKLSGNKVEAGMFFFMVDAYNDLVRTIKDRCTEGVAEMLQMGER